MPRMYTLADVLKVINTDTSSALSPDVSDTDTELINQFSVANETPTTTDASVVVIQAANYNQWTTAVYGAFTWS